MQTAARRPPPRPGARLNAPSLPPPTLGDRFRMRRATGGSAAAERQQNPRAGQGRSWHPVRLCPRPLGPVGDGGGPPRGKTTPLRRLARLIRARSHGGRPWRVTPVEVPLRVEMGTSGHVLAQQDCHGLRCGLAETGLVPCLADQWHFALQGSGRGEGAEGGGPPSRSAGTSHCTWQPRPASVRRGSSNDMKPWAQRAVPKYPAV